MTNLPQQYLVNDGFGDAEPLAGGTKIPMYWRIRGFRNRFIRNPMTWVSIASLFLRIMSAPSVIPVSPHDDLLQVRLAINISRGGWLGPYGDLGHLTMVKPPGYPIFLAISTLLGISPQILVHLALLVVTAALVRQLIPERFHHARTIVYAIGVLWPTLFGSEFSRYYREGLVYVLTLTVLLLMISVCHTLIKKFDGKLLAIKLCALGLTLGLVLITKPIAPAYVPAVGVIFVAIIVKIQKIGTSVTKRLLLVAGLVFLTTIFTFVPSALVAVQNQNTYGVFQVDSYSGGSFKSVVSSITALPPHNRTQSEMVSNAQLETLLKVGPYSAEVAQNLLGETGNFWTGISCSYGGACTSSGAWFQYALRDAIALTGEDTSAIRFNEALTEIHTEIKSYCSMNQDCGGGDLAVGVKMPTDLDWFEFANSYVTVLNEVFFPAVGSSEYLNRNEVSQELYQEWLQMPGIPIRDSKSNYTNPVPGFLASLILPTATGAAVFLFMNGYRKRSLGLSQQFLNGNTKRKSITKVVSDVNILGMIIGLGSFLFLTTQLAVLQASAGSYLHHGADTYSITCLAPFFVFIVSTVSHMLRD